MGREWPEAGETVCNDPDPKMAPTVARSRVPYVQMTLINDIQVNRLECRVEAVAD